MSLDTSPGYQHLLTSITSDERYVKALANVVSPTRYNDFVDALVDISNASNCQKMFVRALTEVEFEKHKDRPETVLRAESTASRYIRSLVRDISSDYVSGLLKDVVGSVVFNGALDLEIDPQRNAEGNVDELDHTAQQFLDVIFGQSIEAFPALAKAIAVTIFTTASKHVDASASLALIGGFVNLRLFNPAIIAPDKYLGFKSEEITPKVRRNLTLIAKLIQNVSNDVEFGSKEPYMVPLNSFISRNRDKMKDFLRKISSEKEEEMSEESRECSLVSVSPASLSRSVWPIKKSHTGA